VVALAPAKRDCAVGTSVGRSGAGFKPPPFVFGFDDVAVMREVVEQCRRHLGVIEDIRPFAEGKIRRSPKCAHRDG